MLQENLKDACEIIQTIITQPLSIPGASENVSLLKAAESFSEKEASFSDLSKILYAFLQYPEPTNNLLIELKLILEDLKKSSS